jgi:hypothetical protein
MFTLVFCGCPKEKEADKELTNAEIAKKKETINKIVKEEKVKVEDKEKKGQKD